MKYAVVLFFVIQNIVSAQTEYSVYDAHIHYSQDMWETLPPLQAIRILKEAGIDKALVSATPTQGAEKLYLADPEFVIPMLRPYKSWRHRFTWFNDATLKAYLLDQLQRIPYKGFGEFHVFGEDADSRPVQDMIELAYAREMPLHAHTDLPGMKIILNKSRNLVVIWAHGGFDVPIETLEEFIRLYPNFYVELSYREGMLDKQQKLTPAWIRVLSKYPQRFLVGMDTYKPRRWANVSEIAQQNRQWLNQLPEKVRIMIASGNLQRLFAE